MSLVLAYENGRHWRIWMTFDHMLRVRVTERHQGTAVSQVFKILVRVAFLHATDRRFRDSSRGGYSTHVCR